MASNQINPLNILNSSNATGLGSGGSLNVLGGVSINKDTFIGGNISISGTTASFADNMIVINSNPSGSVDTGILFQRYTSDISNSNNYSSITYDETNDIFRFGYITSDPQRASGTVNSYIPIQTNKIVSDTITTANLIATNITANNYLFSTTNITASNIYSTNLSAASLSVTNAILTNVTTTNAISTNVTTTNLTATSLTAANMAISGTLTVVNITSTNLVETNISAGNVSASVLSATGNSNTIGSIITTSGNVGIGTTAPSYKLDVNGTIARSGVPLPLFSNGSFTGVTSVDIPTNFVNSSYNYCEIKLRFCTATVLNNIVIKGVNNSDTQLNATEVRENTMTNTGNTTGNYTSGYVAVNSEYNLDGNATITIIKATNVYSNLTSRNHFRVSSVYCNSGVGATRLDGHGFFESYNTSLKSIRLIVTNTSGSFNGSWSTINYY
jgi:hypothetical protein